MSRSLDVLLAELKTTEASAATIGRLPAAAASGNPEVAAKLARELAEHPRYYVKCGPIEMLIDWNEYAMLTNHGANKASRADP